MRIRERGVYIPIYPEYITEKLSFYQIKGRSSSRQKSDLEIFRQKLKIRLKSRFLSPRTLLEHSWNDPEQLWKKNPLIFTDFVGKTIISSKIVDGYRYISICCRLFRLFALHVVAFRAPPRRGL